MGYVIPSLDELPDPTFEEFKKDPEYYWRKLDEYENKPRLFGVLEIPSWLLRILGDFFRVEL